MSYDLMVFDPDVAPRNREEFIAWYREQTEWNEDHSYNDPAVSSPKLRAWFLDIAEDYPAMNGPYASDDFNNPAVTDYSIGRSVIYSAFAWSQCKDAYQTVFESAKKHELGFYDVSGGEGEVWAHDSEGNFICIHADPPNPHPPTDSEKIEQLQLGAAKLITKLFDRGS